MHRDLKEVLFDKATLSSKCRTMGHQLASDFAHKRPLFLVTLSGTLTLCARAIAASASLQQSMLTSHIAAHIQAVKLRATYCYVSSRCRRVHVRI